MKKRSTVLIFFGSIISVYLLSLIVFSETDDKSDHTFKLDSLLIEIPDHWHDRYIDSRDQAKPEDLVQLPQENTYEDYRIYVTRETRDAFVKMAEKAEADSIDLIADSGFRSFAFQKRIFKNRLSNGEAIETILKYVAPPGYSEHHTGRALDLVPSDAIFANTKTYIWLKEHANSFGFFESLPDSDSSVIGWESWHWLYEPQK